MIQSGNYLMKFSNGGIEVLRNGEILYFNKRPMYAFIKTAMSITEFYDAPYDQVDSKGNTIIASGMLKPPTGSELAFQDIYEAAGTGFKVSRTVTVLKNIDDFGFASKIAFVMAASDDVHDYDIFAPANWYRQNEYAKPHVMGYDKDCEYFWRREDQLYPAILCGTAQIYR
jgi:hypothetical protein